jgi:hypothetical protein
MKLSESQKQVLQSYGRSVLATVITAYLAGATSFSDLAAAFAAAALPPLIRWLNPNDAAFGTGSK